MVETAVRIQLCKYQCILFVLLRPIQADGVILLRKLDSLVVALLLAYAVDVGRVDLVPGSHVLFHARRHALLFAAREGGTGLGNALVEAVVLEFLVQQMLASRDTAFGSRAQEPTSMSTRALARLASVRTCFITACLTALESIDMLGGVLGCAKGDERGY